MDDSKKKLAKECERLIKELIDGRDTALADIYDIAGRQMFGVAYNVLQDYQLAEDALQEGLLAIYKNAVNIQDKSKALPWMLTVIRNAALDILRRRKRDTTSEYTEVEVDKELSNDEQSRYISSSKRTHNNHLFLEVEEALGQLDEEERQLVLLKGVAGYSHQEIAYMLNITVTACQKKYQRALKELALFLT